MNINFTIINELISFLIFFCFSLIFILPKIIKKINEFDLVDFKNKIFINYNKLLENKFFSKLIFIESIIKKEFFKITKDINNNIFNKKNILKNIIIIEKKNFIKKIKKILKLINYNFLKNFLFELKFFFLKSFKKIYDEIILYNNEFIILI